MRGVVLLQGVCILSMGGGWLESDEAVGKWESGKAGGAAQI